MSNEADKPTPEQSLAKQETGNIKERFNKELTEQAVNKIIGDILRDGFTCVTKVTYPSSTIEQPKHT